MSNRPVFVVAGIGNGTGIGASTARAFSNNLKYRIALIARNPDHLKKLAEEINASGGEAHPFPVPDYTWSSISSVFTSIRQHFSGSHIRAALFNPSVWRKAPFLELKEEDFKESLDINVVAAAAFSQEAIKAFLESPDPTPEENSPAKGTLIFTGATAGFRGGAEFAVFATGKFGLRALSQSLAREFGKQGIHVAHVNIDGVVSTDRVIERFGKDNPLLQSEQKHLKADSIAKNYLYLHGQDQSAFTQELDLRPSHERF